MNVEGRPIVCFRVHLKVKGVKPEVGTRAVGADLWFDPFYFYGMSIDCRFNGPADARAWIQVLPWLSPSWGSFVRSHRVSRSKRAAAS